MVLIKNARNKMFCVSRRICKPTTESSGRICNPIRLTRLYTAFWHSLFTFQSYKFIFAKQDLA